MTIPGWGFPCFLRSSCCSATSEMSVRFSAAPDFPIWLGQEYDWEGKTSLGSYWVLLVARSGDGEGQDQGTVAEAGGERD